MKKIPLVLALLLMVGSLCSSVALADDKIPQLLLKSFLPLPDNRLVVFGKVLFIDPTEAEENLNFGRVKIFLHHRAKNLPLTISMEGTSIQTQTNNEGDFSVTFPETTVAGIKGETSVTFTSSQFPTYKELITYNLPLHPEFLIVSDIDDSVLVTSEGKLYKTIVNSLVKPIHKREAVSGMPELYQALIKGTHGIDSLLVFLSGSPVYLAPRLEIFFSDKKFPNHSLILRNAGPKEFVHEHLSGSSTKLATNITEYKLLQLGKLFKWYPNLPVILIGDTSAQDPEIYQKMAENFPGKVRLVILRNLSQQPSQHRRYDGIKKLTRLIVWNDPEKLRTALEDERLIFPKTENNEKR